MSNRDSIKHATGRSQYLDDIPVLKNTLYGVILGSPTAHGKITALDPSPAMGLPGVHRVFTHLDIPGINEIGGIVHDETLFAVDEVHYRGQPVALVVADDELTARKAAKLIRIHVDELEPVTDPRTAYERGLLLIPSRTFRMGDVCLPHGTTVTISSRAELTAAGRSICTLRPREHTHTLQTTAASGYTPPPRGQRWFKRWQRASWVLR